MEGHGTISWADGRSYVGKFLKNKLHGDNGVYTYQDQKIYRGPFQNGKKHGKGEIEIPGKGIYKGFWENDREIGAATY